MNAIELGATLYTPGLHPTALSNAYGAIAHQRSMVICLEDAVRDDQIDLAEENLAEILNAFRAKKPSIHVFIRPRNIEMLVRILKMRGVETVAGFVLPKVTTLSLASWLSVLVHEQHAFMPTIEGDEAFDLTALSRLRDQLLPYSERIPAIRIGGNDILNLFAVRRSRVRTAYDGPLSIVIRNITAIFAPHGFGVAAPVFEHFSDHDLLAQEVEIDIEHGLMTKTAVHPSQIALIQSLYQPSVSEMAEARAILDSNAPAVFGSEGSMCEPATHIRWAGGVIQRAQIYGVADQLISAQCMVA
ncbi:HpcH/HpaI aldolase/citrate lyase family protein [Sphingobium aromaticiconvertens]|uniref:HpcH/HpaI aldolase/citrate lyase family protein n=1 Tax=Sphingobium aromaticiconvertens TaxID=365341 RepID=UPI003019C9EF